MSDKNEEQKNSFWLTLPGCITAVGGLITAVVGSVVALAVAGFIEVPHPATPTSPPPITATAPDSEIVEQPSGSSNNPAPFVPSPFIPIVTLTATLTPPPTITPTQPIPQEEYVDSSTVEQDMHACPVGFAIAGVRADRNQFLCRRVMRYGEEKYVVTVLDPGIAPTVRGEMHACPPGMYMRGLRIDRNDLLCSYDGRRGDEWRDGDEFGDTSSVDWDMHVCPALGGITYLTGIREDENRFLCAKHRP